MIISWARRYGITIGAMAAWIATVGAAVPARAGTAVPMVPPSAASQAGTPAGGLQAMAGAGSLADLRWPNFAAQQADVTAFYKAGNYAFAWSRDGRPTAQALGLIECFKQAGAQGLDPENYDGSRWDGRIAKLVPAVVNPALDDEERFDLALTVSAMRMLSDLRVGRINPEHYKFSVLYNGDIYGLADLLRGKILDASNVAAVAAAVEPRYAGYQRAEAALGMYTRLAAAGDVVPLPMPDKGVRPGMPYAAMPLLTTRLMQLGELGSTPATAASPVAPAPSPSASAAQADPNDPPPEPLYSGEVVDAVKHFQSRHGLEADGVLGKATIAALNVPLSARADQLRFTLERYRWMPPTFPEPPIVVNLPEFTLRTMRRQDAPLLTMRVVVGKAYRRQTPVFTGTMRYVIFRPYWDVPPSIQRSELVPKTRLDRNYLASHGFEVVDSDGNVVTDGTISDDVFDQLRSGELQIRQKPGPKNALGLVKFIFPNHYNVYLHSTPEPELFARARRDFSHGCIRVQDPVALAAWVLRDHPEWTVDKIQAAMNGDQTVQVNLAHPIPVLIIYRTAVVQPDGEVQFFNDIYDYDRPLKRSLDSGYPYAGAPPHYEYGDSEAAP
jgi:L,D-transpeptidase YcbB